MWAQSALEILGDYDKLEEQDEGGTVWYEDWGFWSTHEQLLGLPYMPSEIRRLLDQISEDSEARSETYKHEVDHVLGRVRSLVVDILGLAGPASPPGSRGVVRTSGKSALRKYEVETVIRLIHGSEIRCNAWPADVSYVRVLSKGEGSEIAYQSIQDFAKDPSEALGTILLAASEGLRGRRTMLDESILWLGVPGDRDLDASSIRFDMIPKPVSYVRVVKNNPLRGKEIGYWTMEEISEDPSFVLGAFLGAATSLGEKR